MAEIQFRSGSDVTLIDKMGNDARIAMAAWVSTSAEDGIRRANENPDDVPGLIRYLMKHRHGTPFEATAIQVFVKTPIFVWREWHRHRVGFSYNEESARYKQLAPVFCLPPRDRPMVKVEGWKPGRPKFLTLDQESTYVVGNADYKYEEILADMKQGYADEYERYERQLARNLDPGLARDNLPVGIYSSCWVTCNARSLMHFLSLRTHEPDATWVSYPLYEIDEAARKLEAVFAELFPITHKFFCENGRVAP